MQARKSQIGKRSGRLMAITDILPIKIRNLYYGIHQRCYNFKHKSYNNYGGRGIKICKRWHNIWNFYKDIGVYYTKGLTLDRINNNGNYEPSNCRWATIQDQCNNKRNNIFLEYNNEKLTIAQWARKFHVSRQVLHIRYKRGWLPKEIISTPIRTKVYK